MEKWKLKRVKQCDKCPWRVDVDPMDIPDGYSVEKHRALSGTISSGIESISNGKAMACHETDDAHCIGWLVNQIGPGNNIGMRMQMTACENAKYIKTVGDQHETFEDTLPIFADES